MEMSPNNATVFNCSLKKYNQLLRVYGTGSLAELTLLKLIYKYACHSPTEKTLQRLDSMISYLQSSNETICIDTLEGNFFPGGIGDDHITFTTDVPNAKTSNSIKKYSEDEIIKELKDYITRTYDQHYSAGDDKIQTLDLIEACGDGEAFCRSNILKYASRYDKKGTARRDIMKILHYAVLLMHFNDKNAKCETYPQ